MDKPVSKPAIDLADDIVTFLEALDILIIREDLRHGFYPPGIPEPWYKAMMDGKLKEYYESRGEGSINEQRKS